MLGLSCGTLDLKLQHVGSRVQSLTRGWTQAPGIGSAESYCWTIWEAAILIILFYLFMYLFWNLDLNIFVLEYSCFTMLCWFLLYSKVSLLYVYIYPLFFGFFLGHHRELGEFLVLDSGFSFVIYFIHSINSAYMSTPVSQFIPSHPSPLVPVCLFTTSMSLFLLYKWDHLKQFFRYLFPGLF